MQKTFLLCATALLIHLGLPKADAANISVDFFYDQLGDYGDWVEVGDYGYGWQPRDVDEDWRPYSDGRWAYTDAGWTWLTEEPYGWAVYHYGRWTRLEDRGWVWIPGTEWAPAWVSWRRSPKHVGWAPLPPEANFRREVGIRGWADSYYDIGPTAYRFVEVRDFGAQRLRSVFIEPQQNVTIIRQTTNITQITYVNSVVNNGGPRYEEISRESAEPVRRLRLDRRVEIEGDRSSFRGERLRSRVEGDSLTVFAPGFDARAAAPPQKVMAKIEKVEVNRGWKDAGPAADVEKLRAKVRNEAKVPKGLPPQPKFEKLAEQTTTTEVPPTKERPTKEPTTKEPTTKEPTTKEPTAKEQSAVAPPGERPRGEKMKDGRGSEGAPTTPVPPAPETKVAPLESTTAPDAPTKPPKPGKAGKPEKTTDPKVPGAPPAPASPEAKPEKAVPQTVPERSVPPAPEPAETERKGKNRNQPAQPRGPMPAEPEEKKVKQETPETRRESPPAPERPPQKKERPLPPEPAGVVEERPKREPGKPKAERPEAAPDPERAKPRAERQNAPDAAPGSVPQPAPRGEAQKPGVGKGKAKGEKKSDDETPKAE